MKGYSLAMSRGFALVTTVSLMVLLAVICIGLLGLSAVSLRSASQEMAQAEAQANARLALMLAIGELQKTMGPDQRVSARAETLAMHPKVGVSVPKNTGKAWWVGVSHSDPAQTIGSAVQPVSWLVSGLDPSASSDQQLSQPLKNPVPLYGNNSIDTAVLTGGQAIEAGTVAIKNQQGQSGGGFAWLVDDNGMKAQLAAAKPEVRNDLARPHGGGVLPGTHNLGMLDGMAALEKTPWDKYNRLISLNDLPLIGGDQAIARAKRLGYTTRSLGVLSDARRGGLKRDLTIAFENEAVFNAVFPKNRSAFGEKYLVMDPEKLKQCSDLQINGYIHWESFKDFYNIKRSIQKRGSEDYLDIVLITKNGIFTNLGTPFARGQMGPHEIGANADVPTEHQQMPYGDFVPITSRGNSETYKHSPLLPILSRFQQNAWVQYKGRPDRLSTNVQLWQAQYNPYNIGLNVLGDAPQYGPRIIHYPQVFITVDGVLQRSACFSGKRQTSVPHEVMLGAGRSHVYAFKDYGGIGRDDDEFLYDDMVKNLTLQSIYKDYPVGTAPASATLTFDFVMERPSMMHGSNSNAQNGNHEVSQVFWAPFAWDNINNLPGKRIIKRNVPRGAWNENSMASFAFQLRTTREPGASVRPLVDANIRAMFCNTKWDSPLGLDLLAAYSPDNRGETEERIFQMNVQDSPKGYTYWGAGRDALDGFDRVILFDVPREDLLSLGQLQHANAGRFSYEPSYIVGNSYANPRIRQDSWKDSVNDTYSTQERGLSGFAIPGRFNLYDSSYLVNEELWDSYIFTTIPQVADNFTRVGTDLQPGDGTFRALLDGTALLPNPRFIPYEPPGSKFDRSTLQMPSTSRGMQGGFYHNSGHLLVDGAFNVNSTSVDAWEAFLSGTHGLPYQKINTSGVVTGFSAAGDVKDVRFPRVKSVLGKGIEKNALDENFWIGFRSLKPEEVRKLAEAIVEEIRKRGPFLTLGGFVNRKLERGELGAKGALQAALDATVNKDLDSDFGMAATHSAMPKDSTQGAGFPGQLLQGDILQALSPYMTVRSDTFTIRSYGESLDPSGGVVRARAWCEATVQRYPDPVAETTGMKDALAELVRPGSRYGRGFRITSFRWLNPDEI
jgi:hypothetical protein